MSTEKDRKWVAHFACMIFNETNPITIADLEDAFHCCIQHARQGERERLGRFLRKIIDDQCGRGHEMEESSINESIDEFLEQEAKDGN